MAEVQITRELSTAAKQKIIIANNSWGRAKQSVLDVYHQLIDDGCTSIEAGDICRRELTIFSPSTLRGVLPSEAKHLEKRNKNIVDVNEDAPILAHSQEIKEKTPEELRHEILVYASKNNSLTKTNEELRTNSRWKEGMYELQENKIKELQDGTGYTRLEEYTYDLKKQIQELQTYKRYKLQYEALFSCITSLGFKVQLTSWEEAPRHLDSSSRHFKRTYGDFTVNIT